jgi:DNA-directed RNA polymerase specialized sigma subunit
LPNGFSSEPREASPAFRRQWDRFDVDKGADFLSFALATMMGEVRRHFPDCGWAIKVPRRVNELRPRLIRARADLPQPPGPAPNATEIAERIGCSHMHVSRLLAKALDTLRHHVRQPELAAPGQNQVFES